MNETQLIKIIKDITESAYIGDDCAWLKELGITISQDSLVEDVHFRQKWMNANELGKKTALVNISDILASGAKPAFMTISLSLPSNLNEDFVKNFYTGVMEICNEYDIKIIGGDLTGGNKIFVSATIIGKIAGRNIASRKNAKIGYNVWVYGEHGSSAAGLKLLEASSCQPLKLIKAHKEPKLCEQVPEIPEPFAMMDTSDGLADALYKIATASQVTLNIDFEKIPYDNEIKIFKNYEQLILYGGEDYGLVAVIPSNINVENFTCIGRVVEKTSAPLIINKQGTSIEISSINNMTFNHF